MLDTLNEDCLRLIVYRLDEGSTIAFHSTNRHFFHSADDAVLATHFTNRAHLVNSYGLQALADMTAVPRIRIVIRCLTLIVPSTYLYDGFAQTRAAEEYPDKAKKLRESGGSRQSTNKETIHRPSKDNICVEALYRKRVRQLAAEESNELLESALGSTLLEQICNNLKEAGRSFKFVTRSWSADGVREFCWVPFFDESPNDQGGVEYSNVSGL
ncbi:hypothetical protein LTR78_000008 [Recurvomyces mirabilis]|uniref:Uncharacterized protein n=1 Tax=Recurvomyces mirabilis TaxID=574656 RepID=A0AAE0WX57_9PEZI|nr:hypothetical protein LTR78_000008 [Recurvomyces mirabilis]KAK5161665.1 hypothetical protein LTS14_000009 [Recurvomyces mirabilis]